MQGALVVVAANLKTAKLAGEVSQGMILAADKHNEDIAIVRTIFPPGRLGWTSRLGRLLYLVTAATINCCGNSGCCAWFYGYS